MKDKIIQILRNSSINFNALCEEEHEAIEDLLRDKLDTEAGVAFDSGVSKFVILIKGADYVLKIPYTFLINQEDYESDWSYWENEDNEEEKEAYGLTKEPQIEDYYQYFDSAISDEVDTSDNWDYCALECAFYEKAVECDLAQYFAKEELYATVADYPIYIQQRVSPFASNGFSWELSKTISKKCTDLKVRCFNTEWISDFFNYYGEEEFVRLSQFLEEMKIYDLHSGNLGYYQGAPIIMDYSDFREW